MVGNWGGEGRENERKMGMIVMGGGEKEEIQLWIEKGLNKLREW